MSKFCNFSREKFNTIKMVGNPAQNEQLNNFNRIEKNYLIDL